MNAPLSQLAGDLVAPKTPCRWRATTAAATDEPSPRGEAVVVVRGILTAAVRRLAFSTPLKTAAPVAATTTTIANYMDMLPAGLQQRIALMACHTAPAVLAELQRSFGMGALWGCELVREYMGGGRQMWECEQPVVNVCAVQFLRSRFGVLCQIIRPDRGEPEPFFAKMTTDELRNFSEDPDFPIDAIRFVARVYRLRHPRGPGWEEGWNWMRWDLACMDPAVTHALGEWQPPYRRLVDELRYG